MYSDSMFCPCCGMQLRLTPSNRRRCKEILRKRKSKYTEIVDRSWWVSPNGKLIMIGHSDEPLQAALLILLSHLHTL
jgi:predicted amidophosphoribosyltransferase